MLRRLLLWYDSAEAWDRSPVAHRAVQVVGWSVRIAVTVAAVAFTAIGAWTYLNQDDVRIDPINGGGGDTCFETYEGFDC